MNVLIIEDNIDIATNIAEHLESKGHSTDFAQNGILGINHVALGSDFDGNVQMPFDVSNMSLITQELILASYTKQEIQKITGQNVICLLKNSLPN
jgi:microsomal dipeptidase-like Zn-dependent dipeptidase